MDIESLSDGDLWFRFSDEETHWGYGLIGTFVWSGISVSTEGAICGKRAEVLFLK